VSDYSRHQAWQAGIRNAAGQTHRARGDEFHQGNCGGYSESMRCPNGLPIDRRTPGETQWWRDKMERLQRELQGYREADEWRRLGEVSDVVFTSGDIAGLVELTKGAYNEQ
jgi:hypothetical protein